MRFAKASRPPRAPRFHLPFGQVGYFSGRAEAHSYREAVQQSQSKGLHRRVYIDGSEDCRAEHDLRGPIDG